MNSFEKNGACEIIQVPETTQVHFHISQDCGSYVPKHWHPALELILLLDGNLTVQNGNSEEVLRPGECSLISPYVPHATKCLTQNHAILLQIPLDFLKHWVPDAQNYCFRLPAAHTSPKDLLCLTRIRELLLQMQAAQELPEPSRLFRFQSLLFELMFQLFDSCTSYSLPGAVTKNTKNLSRLEPVLSHIRANYRRPISLTEISGIACLEEGYFCRFFKNSMGMTFLEYQNQLRLSFIYQELISTDDPTEMIRERHGFTNERLFRRMFREQFHTTPTGLRNQLLAAKKK